MRGILVEAPCERAHEACRGSGPETRSASAARLQGVFRHWIGQRLTTTLAPDGRAMVIHAMRLCDGTRSAGTVTVAAMFYVNEPGGDVLDERMDGLRRMTTTESGMTGESDAERPRPFPVRHRPSGSLMLPCPPLVLVVAGSCEAQATCLSWRVGHAALSYFGISGLFAHCPELGRTDGTGTGGCDASDRTSERPSLSCGA